MDRRNFLKSGGTTALLASVAPESFAAQTAAVSLVVDSTDTVATSKPVAWAVDQLAQALTSRGVAVAHVASMDAASKSSICIVAAGAHSSSAISILKTANVVVKQQPEALALVQSSRSGKLLLLACGYDMRGLVYALTELTDTAQTAADPLHALASVKTIAEQPANQVRSLTRLFCSDVEDKPWYNDREMWPKYFDMLVAQRFNRFNLAFGIGYDFIRKVTDAYFLFTYPFLLKVPGYNVHVPQLTDEERDRNLEMLKYISEQCVMRGLEFHVGLWMHGYVWIDSPDANYTIEGLDKATHGPYCRDAVRLLLQTVPNIQGLTFRIHGESGVEEGSFDFWKTVFDGVATCGRRVPIDMHPKGMSQQMVEIALNTKQPVQMSPKFWAEHMGMTYHQADIRVLEKPKAENKVGLMALSDGTRSFLRYGYGDLLQEDRKWSVVHRIWPGTQRVLLWGDPVFAAAYSRAFSFCGSNGVEVMEELSFKGRRGSGHAGSRCAYADVSYNPRWDWQKYEYGLRLWGRMLYNPETKPEVWQRFLTQQFGPGAGAMENALANVSRILPIVLTAHAPSAGNNTYWPELYLNQSMVDAEHPGPYRDSPTPRVFGTASSLDPKLFQTINGHAEDLLANRSDGRYSPVEVAQWIESYAAAGRKSLAQAEVSSIGRGTATYRRAKIDILIQAGLGEFFAAKFRGGVLFHLFEATGENAALEASISQYTKARASWAELAKIGKDVYMSDITLGEEPQLRGHWLDRLPAMDEDIAAISVKLKKAPSVEASPKLTAAMQEVFGPSRRKPIKVKHDVPARFDRGQPLLLSLDAPSGSLRVQLHYRHVDQAENYQTIVMEQKEARFRASIPAAYTQTEFPLEYFFEVNDGTGIVGLYPGFVPELTNQPYFVVRSS